MVLFSDVEKIVGGSKKKFGRGEREREPACVNRSLDFTIVNLG